ncbi:MAG: hypothetical protein ABIR24_12600 [Verrucomicrobiota bacterium]
MRIQLRKTHGNVLFGTLVATSIICLYLGSYLTLIRNENQLTRRSQTWNGAIPIAEAGIEEAFTRLQWNTNITSGNNNWVVNGSYYIKTNYLNTNEHYIVGILLTSGQLPVIVSQGFTRPSSQTNFISRTIRVNTRPKSFFGMGMVADISVDFNGDRVIIDSFDSSDPRYSTNGGQYHVSRRKDNGTVAVNAGLSSTPSSGGLGNVDIYGKITTGPGSTQPYIGPQGIVGSSNYIAVSSNQGTIQSGAWTNDANFDLDPVELPFTSANAPPTTNGYKYVLGTGDYRVSDFNAANTGVKVLVTGNARLLVTSSFDFKGLLTIQTNATLQLYMSAPSAKISGVQNLSGVAKNFTYYGTTNNSSLTISGNGTFSGAIYAPSANFTMDGGGSTDFDFSGASVTKLTTMNGRFKFHYDEELGRSGAINGFAATSWDELILSWNTILSSNMTTAQVQAAP